MPQDALRSKYLRFQVKTTFVCCSFTMFFLRAQPPPLSSSTLLYGMLGVHRAAAAGAGQERAGAGGGHLPLPLLLLMRNHHSAGGP